jgi:enoyl-CoA hydratase
VQHDTYETLIAELDEGILTVTIDRPEALNALSPIVIDELRSLIAHVQNSVGASTGWPVRGIIVTGSGEKSFVAGADIKAMADMSTGEADKYTAIAQELTSWIEELPIPVIAAVNGFALGGGLEIAMSCDFIYATQNASFGQPEVQLGLVPGFGGSVRLQQYVGAPMARELIFTGRRIKVDEAQRIGLVSRVFESKSEMLAGARDTLELVKAVSPVAVNVAKRSIRQTSHVSTRDGLDLERDLFVSMFSTADMREGTRAFVAKETPNFPGN